MTAKYLSGQTYIFTCFRLSFIIQQICASNIFAEFAANYMYVCRYTYIHLYMCLCHLCLYYFIKLSCTDGI